MKTLLSTLTFMLLLVQGASFAHSDHGVISGQTAMNITKSSLKKMAFKDFGFEVGKLASSWKEIQDKDINVVDVKEHYYIVSAANAELKQTIYFQINNGGMVVKVKANNDF
jgi:hypothetical protein